MIAGIALVPGYLNAQLLSSVLLDRARPLAVPATLPDLAVLVAAYDEEASIGSTAPRPCGGPGGWPDSIGEDIVLTWALLRAGGRTGYECTAVAFTDVPTRLRPLMRQRRRWARGMIEGLRVHGWALIRGRRAYAHSIGVDVLFPFLDAAYSVAVPAGLVLAATGRSWIIGPLTLLVLPLNLAIGALLFDRQRRALAEVGLRVRRAREDLIGLAAFVLVYQLLMSPVAFSGCASEILRRRRVR